MSALQPSAAADNAIVRKRYDRIAPIYDALEAMMELAFKPWRRRLWAQIGSDRVLEIGVGTGKNIPFYPRGAQVTGIDISPRMLERATKRADKYSAKVELLVADVQALPFTDASFDVAVSTCVFCSVPDPVRGLAEIRRVLRPGGRLLMVEHVLSEKPLARWLMHLIDPIPFHLWGAHIDRETLHNLALAGFKRVDAENLMLDVVKLIDARNEGVSHAA